MHNICMLVYVTPLLRPRKHRVDNRHVRPDRKRISGFKNKARKARFSCSCVSCMGMRLVNFVTVCGVVGLVVKFVICGVEPQQ